jgi:hypothetical protein
MMMMMMMTMMMTTMMMTMISTIAITSTSILTTSRNSGSTMIMITRSGGANKQRAMAWTATHHKSSACFEQAEVQGMIVKQHTDIYIGTVVMYGDKTSNGSDNVLAWQLPR